MINTVTDEKLIALKLAIKLISIYGLYLYEFKDDTYYFKLKDKNINLVTLTFKAYIEKSGFINLIVGDNPDTFVMIDITNEQYKSLYAYAQSLIDEYKQKKEISNLQLFINKAEKILNDKQNNYHQEVYFVKDFVNKETEKIKNIINNIR